jgi:hypothetical protein
MIISRKFWSINLASVTHIEITPLSVSQKTDMQISVFLLSSVICTLKGKEANFFLKMWEEYQELVNDEFRAKQPIRMGFEENGR